jgi:hypothetical protein
MQGADGQGKIRPSRECHRLEVSHHVRSEKHSVVLILVFIRIPRIQGAQEATLTAEADLAITTHRQAWSRPPINVDFSGEFGVSRESCEDVLTRITPFQSSCSQRQGSSSAS